MLLLYRQLPFFRFPLKIDLHSTMLLLYLITVNQYLCCFVHLHSTMLLLYHLLLYAHDITSLEFTFHYASTLSVLQASLLRGTFPFTFHYASTLSLCIFPVSRVFLIYIPLCFYFISSSRMRWELMTEFTFHYASTLSTFCDPSQSCATSIYIPLCFYFIVILHKVYTF